MKFAYDLDGTLVDTEPLVRKAYELAGATPPDDFFGKPFSEWSSDWEMHDRKTIIYLKMIREGGVIPKRMAEFARFMGGTILTGASREAANEILDALEIFNCDLWTSQSVASKIAWLTQNTPGIMFEDDMNAVKKFREETEWTICHVR